MKRLGGWLLAWIGLGALAYAIWFFSFTKPSPAWGIVLGAGAIASVIMMQGLRIVDRNPRKTKLTK